MTSPHKERPTSQSKPKGRPHSGAVENEKSLRESKEKRKVRGPEKRSSKPVAKIKGSEYAPSQTPSNTLSADSLAKLNAFNEKASFGVKQKVPEPRQKEKVVTGRVIKERGKHKRDESTTRRKKKRVVSGAILEEGRGRRGGYMSENGERKSIGKGCWIIIGLVVLLLVILIPVGVLVIGKHNNSSTPATSSGPPSNGGSINGVTEGDIPTAAKGSYLDPFTWLDTTDFNVTYTNTTFGGLPIMGLNSTWDDTAKANQYVPALNETFIYGTMPIRGVNLGGWLSIEPFITPSMFNSYSGDLGIVDEYTLTQHLGPSAAAQTLEKHYSTFINEQTFADVQTAGFDHVRIPFSYWAITTYTGDPYVPKISWRYLLRGIEYARKYGLRVNLDLHAVPGSQNGWNHSGRQGMVGWLNGTDGALNGQRSLDLHNQLSTFFAQPRYKNVIAIYGLVNEPKMTVLPVDQVLTWTTSAIDIVRKNGIQQTIAFGDGFLGLPNWKGKLQGINGLVMDAHQYVIFNVDQIAFSHQTKINFACSGWTAQMKQSINVATGYVKRSYPLDFPLLPEKLCVLGRSYSINRFGPTMCGEWSQADTDCAVYLNNVNVGSRWTGTMNLNDPNRNVLTPSCPPNAGKCECTDANAEPSRYSDTYKQWLLMNAEAQMTSFEIGWGWFYWTWVTETSVQWSWKLGMQAGILPTKTWNRDFNCTQTVPSFSGLPENY